MVVPVFNEEEAIASFLAEIRKILKGLQLSYEIIFVDDGSRDRTPEFIIDEARMDKHLRLVQLSRNFGKEAALTAGLDWSSGEAVIPIDIDLQDPPELIGEFVRLWREGYDIVCGRRISRGSDTKLKRHSAQIFYKIFNRVAASGIEENVGDFRLMSRPVVEATVQLRERNRFMKGLFAWVGFRSIAVDYERPQRAAGQSKFNYPRLWNFAVDGITSFSTIPLRIWTYVGIIVAMCAVVYTVVIIGQTLILGREVPGYASLMVVMLVLGAVQLISLGIIGEYLGRLYIESKQRPIYIVRRTIGLTTAIADAEAKGMAAAPTSPVPALRSQAG